MNDPIKTIAQVLKSKALDLECQVEEENLQRFERLDMIAVLDEIADMLESTVAKNETVQESDKWIPIEERLPEEGQIVLYHPIRHDLPEQPLAVYKKKKNNEKPWHIAGIEPYSNVTHWMPLPQPPQETQLRKEGETCTTETSNAVNTDGIATGHHVQNVTVISNAEQPSNPSVSADVFLTQLEIVSSKWESKWQDRLSFTSGNGAHERDTLYGIELCVRLWNTYKSNYIPKSHVQPLVDALELLLRPGIFTANKYFTKGEVALDTLVALSKVFHKFKESFPHKGGD